MEQNGANNGQDAKPPASSAASGANKSPKKRRKVNHGMLKGNPERKPEGQKDSTSSLLELHDLKHWLIVERLLQLVYTVGDL